MSPPAAYGWGAVSRDTSKFTASAKSSDTKPVSASSISVPRSPLADTITELATKYLPLPTINHSKRVFLYGAIIMQQHFPDLLEQWPDFAETYYLTCMLHDIGTAEAFLKTTKMSFDFKGAFIAAEWLRKGSAAEDLADAVAEAIIRHQDIGTTGEITVLGGIIQVATLFDNAGALEHLVHEDTIKSVVEMYPRYKWSGCFASTVREEIGAKPWCHSTHIENFAEKVEGNMLMEPFEGEAMPAGK
jgi:cyanamide hydratase